ncbi:hypothetical protein Taro_015517 [Colocasia esculenta]|uniref:Uncharacterized protein n=1 Tax=Colocasia esculenta TaxID=4460 RepID=A0A843UMF0_COLES|nr:hypothetical protein [Colocasia esculenta]
MAYEHDLGRFIVIAPGGFVDGLGTGNFGPSNRAQLEVVESEKDESVDAWVAACRGGWVFMEGHMMWILYGTTFSCKGSVDTTISGVDTMAQSKDRNVKKRSTSVDTSPGQVDTRDLSQGIVFPVWDSVSTHLMGRSTHSEISVT